ncbi:hypothetical protein [Chamaesiphon minutus]|uniref:Uncharacterized protein n=1 Tax=Chamaesiphon minutus (strain ATCC 27169 / PCC 6605) TaxID=1173020 RepID=K9UM36_CHAP6|nr:hypothetical protein [Chamaesiphon minutus]AFY95506.1 hypothetical protein Cha6605_4587 [Chamaesiphon minutus PCC 6605]
MRIIGETEASKVSVSNTSFGEQFLAIHCLSSQVARDTLGG